MDISVALWKTVLHADAVSRSTVLLNDRLWGETIRHVYRTGRNLVRPGVYFRSDSVLHIREDVQRCIQTDVRVSQMIINVN